MTLKQQIIITRTQHRRLWLLPGSNDGSADTTGSPERLLGPDEHVGDVLVLAQQRDVEQDLQGFRVCRHHDELRLSSVESLGGLIGALPQLFVVGGLLDQIQYLGSQRLVSEWVGLGVDFFRHDDDDVGLVAVFLSAQLTRDHGVTASPRFVWKFEVCYEY